MGPPRVVMIALDAAEVDLMQTGVSEGWLPATASLLERGHSVITSGPHRLFPGAAWPSVITGAPPEDHLLIFDRQLRSGAYEIENVRPEDCRRPPFWRYVSDAGLSSTIASVYSAPLLDGLRGTQVIGWGSFDPYSTKLDAPRSSPPQVLAWLDREFPGHRTGSLKKIPTTSAGVRRFRDEAVRQILEQAKALALLMDRTEWSLFVGAIPELHEVGHLLWHLEYGCGADGDDAPADVRNAVRDTYRAADDALGQLASVAPAGATLLLFTPHGQRCNSGVQKATGAILERGGWLVRRPAIEDSHLRRLAAVRSAAHRLLPLPVRRALGGPVNRRRAQLLAAMVLADVNWERTRAFPLLGDGVSLIRFNLAGREPGGIVQPGREYDELCNEIAAAAAELVDGETGARAVVETVRTDAVLGRVPGDVLPDLVIVWDTRVFRTLRSPVLGEISVPDDYRTGDHHTRGFVCGVGPDIEPSGVPRFSARGVSILDVAPTVLTLLGVPVPPELPGKPIDLFVA